MSTSRKVLHWDGPNKQRARSLKLTLVRHAASNGYLPTRLRALTFAGAKAHFERGLLRQKLIKPEDIITIQDCRRSGRAEVLRRLIATRDTYLPDMRIWPDEFNAFRRMYSKERILLGDGSWTRFPLFRPEMYKFHKTAGPDFHVLDIDICGIFNEKNGGDVSGLMEKRALAKRGLLFVNHQKGRDGRHGSVFQFVREYFRSAPFDPDEVIDAYGERLDLSSEDDLSRDLLRRVLVPAYYVCEAYKHGYSMEVVRMMEYRDRDPVTRGGVKMLQWYFQFEQHASASFRDKSVRFVNALAQEQETFTRQLDIIRREAYPYTEATD